MAYQPSYAAFSQRKRSLVKTESKYSDGIGNSMRSHLHKAIKKYMIIINQYMYIVKSAC